MKVVILRPRVLSPSAVGLAACVVCASIISSHGEVIPGISGSVVILALFNAWYLIRSFSVSHVQ